MPIYKYECEACGHVFEDLRGFNDPNPDECPECEHTQVRRLITGGNFVLKGGGWYASGYESTGGSSSSSSKSSSSDSSESTDSSSSSEGGTEGSSDGTEAA